MRSANKGNSYQNNKKTGFHKKVGQISWVLHLILFFFGSGPKIRICCNIFTSTIYALYLAFLGYLKKSPGLSNIVHQPKGPSWKKIRQKVRNVWQKGGGLTPRKAMYDFFAANFWLPCSPISPHVQGGRRRRSAKIFYSFFSLVRGRPKNFFAKSEKCPTFPRPPP